MYEKFEKEYEAYQKDPSLPAPILEVECKNIQDVARYYCESELAPSTPEFRLEMCYQPNDTTGDQDKIFIPKLIEGEKLTSNVSADSNGFMVETMVNPVYAIAPEAFAQVTNLTELTLPESTKYIGDNAFEGATAITKIAGSGIVAVGNQAFKNCTSIEVMDVMSSLTLIGAEAFRASGIRTITFPQSLTTIGAGAFADCKHLALIEFTNSPRKEIEIRKYTFYNCPVLGEFEWGTASPEITAIGEGAFGFETATPKYNEF